MFTKGFNALHWTEVATVIADLKGFVLMGYYRASENNRMMNACMLAFAAARCQNKSEAAILLYVAARHLEGAKLAWCRQRLSEYDYIYLG